MNHQSSFWQSSRGSHTVYGQILWFYRLFLHRAAAWRWNRIKTILKTEYFVLKQNKDTYFVSLRHAAKVKKKNKNTFLNKIYCSLFSTHWLFTCSWLIKTPPAINGVQIYSRKLEHKNSLTYSRSPFIEIISIWKMHNTFRLAVETQQRRWKDTLVSLWCAIVVQQQE